MLLKRLENDNKPELKLNQLQQEMRDQVNTKVEKGIYQLEDLDCPICNSKHKDCIGKKDRYGLSYITNICTDCGFVYTSPRMTQAAYNEFYNVEYRKLYVGKETATENFFYSQTIKGKKIYDYLESHQLLKPSSYVLEVGCGAGGILSVFEKNGHTVKGTDLGRDYVEFGKKNHGLDLEVGFLSDVQLERQPDIIIYNHVMEHILDLDKELETIKKVISKDTIVYIEVPGVKEIHKNFESNVLKYFQNAHTFHFTQESLTNLFSKNGFEFICGNQYVQSAFRLAKNEHEVSIKNDYQDVKSYLLQTEEKRKGYNFTANGMKKNFEAFVLKSLDDLKLRPIARKLKNTLTNNN